MLGRSAQEEFAAYLDAHGAALMGMLRRLCRGGGHDAEDVFQETAARVWRNFARRPWLRNPRAWVMTIGYRAFLDHRARHPALAEQATEPIDPRGESPVAVAERTETEARVRAAIEALPEPVREVVILHYLGGLSIRATANAMGLAEGTVKSRLNAALGKLRGTLD